MKTIFSAFVFLLAAVGIAVAALPRTELPHSVDDAKRRIDALLEGFVPTAEKVADGASRMAEVLRDRVERGGRELFTTDDEPQFAERSAVNVYRPSVSGRARVILPHRIGPPLGYGTRRTGDGEEALQGGGDRHLASAG